jgi:hypothetical protein
LRPDCSNHNSKIDEGLHILTYRRGQSIWETPFQLKEPTAA